MTRRLVVAPLALALAFVAPFAAAVVVDDPAPSDPEVPVAPNGLGTLDSWVDANGDTMYGDLKMGARSVTFNGVALASPAAGTLQFNGRLVCVDGNGGCVGPQGPAGPVGPVGPTGATGPQGPAGTSVQAVDCGAPKFVRAIGADGVVTCADDRDALSAIGCGTEEIPYMAGTWECRPYPWGADGLVSSGGEFRIATGGVTTAKIAPGAVTGEAIADAAVHAADVNASEVQLRVAGECAAGRFQVRTAADGTVACGALLAGPGLLTTNTAGGGVSLALSSSGCTVANMVWKWTGSTWSCQRDGVDCLPACIHPSEITDNAIFAQHVADSAIGLPELALPSGHAQFSGSLGSAAAHYFAGPVVVPTVVATCLVTVDAAIEGATANSAYGPTLGVAVREGPANTQLVGVSSRFAPTLANSGSHVSLTRVVTLTLNQPTTFGAYMTTSPPEWAGDSFKFDLSWVCW